VAPFLICVGFGGDRADHTLAACNAIVRHSGPPAILMAERDVAFALRHEVRLALPAGTRVSLFPMAEVSARSSGLRWQVDGLSLSPAGRIGTSNAATGPVTLTPLGPGLLVILPRRWLAVAIAALVPGWSPPAPPAAPGGSRTDPNR
jgi:thiamine pyrophosphokinase